MDGHRRRSIGRGATLVAALALGGVAVATTSTAATPGATHAWTVLRDGEGDLVGFALFIEDAAARMHVNVHALGLSAGQHGIHVHAIGNCDGPGFTGAGSHHNPSASPHGRHAGDLPNLEVNGAGRGRLSTRTAHFTLSDGPTAVLGGDGSALVVHALADDYVTDPTGNSGSRIACGVIHPA